MTIEALEPRRLMSAYPADFNGDYTVNTVDFNILWANWHKSPRTFAQGDWSGDHRVDSLDFNALAATFARHLNRK